MISLGVSQTLYGSSTTGSQVNITVSGLLMTSASPPVASAYEDLYQGQLAASAASVYTPGGSATALIANIALYNTGATAQTVNLYKAGTASSNLIATVVLPANGWAEYEAGNGWTVYSSSGLQVTGTSLVLGGLGTPSGSATSITVGTDTLVGGTLFQLPTNGLAVGQRYRFTLTITKTAAGTATWTAKVKFGTAGTNADGATATWTSGTNTAALDQMLLLIDCNITALGSGTSATMTCVANSTSQQSNVTGLGSIAGTPGSTTGFNSTATSPYMHVDLNAGTSAVMTAWGMAERIA
jgi:hypothetical protein